MGLKYPHAVKVAAKRKILETRSLAQLPRRFGSVYNQGVIVAASDATGTAVLIHKNPGGHVLQGLIPQFKEVKGSHVAGAGAAQVVVQRDGRYAYVVYSGGYVGAVPDGSGGTAGGTGAGSASGAYGGAESYPQADVSDPPPTYDRFTYDAYATGGNVFEFGWLPQRFTFPGLMTPWQLNGAQFTAEYQPPGPIAVDQYRTVPIHVISPADEIAPLDYPAMFGQSGTCDAFFLAPAFPGQQYTPFTLGVDFFGTPEQWVTDPNFYLEVDISNGTGDPGVILRGVTLSVMQEVVA